MNCMSAEAVGRYMPPVITLDDLTAMMGTIGMRSAPRECCRSCRIPGKAGGVGGRIPDLIVWSKTQADGVWLSVTDVLLMVEIISPGSEAIDTVAKRTEYAGAGIPQYSTDPATPGLAVCRVLTHAATGDAGSFTTT